MQLTTINTDRKYTHIIHVADIHIRLTKRHAEYNAVFEEFYKEIDKSPPDTLIAILGDLFHNKADLTPECIEVAANFLTSVASRRDTIIIAGNHDATLNNKNRLDCITPIVNAVNHTALHYLRANGLFRMGNILFNNYSIFNEPVDYIDANKIPSALMIGIDHKIALFHGPVQDAMTDVGFRVSSKTVSNASFDGHHIVLLGDIHKYQMLQERSVNYKQPVIVYPGSMIQQNHGEQIEGHGYVMWDLETHEFQHIPLRNEYGYMTVNVVRGELLTTLDSMPKKVNLRVKCVETVPSELKLIMEKMHSRHHIIDVVYEKTEAVSETPINIIDQTSIDITHIFDVNYQNKLIRKYLAEKFPNLTEAHYVQIDNLNQEFNRDLPSTTLSRNIRWKPKIFEFENMFSYGDGNVIDFSKLHDIVGLFAPNASGKSSILSALSYCLFDKCDRTFKASLILNSQKMSFNCRFNFEIEGVDYFIERKGIQDKKGNVKVLVKFYKRENGVDIDLNGEARRNTNDIIRDYIGTYDDFLLTVLSVQGSSAGFIDMGQADRKDLIAKFMGITVFDQLDTIAKDKSKEISALLKNYIRQDYPAQLEKVIQDIQQLERLTTNQCSTLEKLAAKISIDNETMLNITRQIIPLKGELIDIDRIRQQHRAAEMNIENTTLTLNAQLEIEKTLRLKKDQLNDQLSKIDVSALNDRKKLYTELDAKLRTVVLKLGKSDSTLRSNELKLEKLKEHKYDPACPYCINNVFVRDAVETESRLSEQKSAHAELELEMNSIREQLTRLGDVERELTDYNTLEKEQNSVQIRLYQIGNSLSELKNTITTNQRKIDECNVKIQIYEQDKTAIETNRKLDVEINTVKDNIARQEVEVKRLTQQYMVNSGQLNSQKQQKLNIEDIIKTARVWELQLESYQYYLSAISRDGIPYDLISQALPTIEKEVNSILRNIVDFTLSLETDGKNVSGFVNYGGKKWAMETASGLEKFVLSLAIRVALLHISNLPRPGFIAIDEGFGCADKDNLNSMGTLLTHFKSYFDFIWVVSHLDSLRDVADNQLEINKERGFSKILYV